MSRVTSLELWKCLFLLTWWHRSPAHGRLWNTQDPTLVSSWRCLHTAFAAWKPHGAIIDWVSSRVFQPRERVDVQFCRRKKGGNQLFPICDRKEGTNWSKDGHSHISLQSWWGSCLMVHCKSPWRRKKERFIAVTLSAAWLAAVWAPFDTWERNPHWLIACRGT